METQDGRYAVRGGGVFSDEEIQLLRELPAVANVTRNRITYSDAFKQVCTIRCGNPMLSGGNGVGFFIKQFPGAHINERVR